MGWRPWRDGRWWGWPAFGLALLCSVALVSCTAWVGWRAWSKYQAYARANAALAAEASALPMPPGSKVLGRYDGTSMARIEACNCLIADLLIGNDLPAADVYKFYKDEMVGRGWSVGLEPPGGLAMTKGWVGVEVSNTYYVSAAAGHDEIKRFESQYESLARVVVSCWVFGPEACEDASRRFFERVN